MTKQRTPPQLSCRCQLYSTASHRMAKTDTRWPLARCDRRQRPARAVSAAQHRPAQSPRPHPSLDAVDRTRQVQCTRPPSSRRPNPTTMPNPAIHPSRRDGSIDLDSQQRARALFGSSTSPRETLLEARAALGPRPALVFSTGRR